MRRDLKGSRSSAQEGPLRGDRGDDREGQFLAELSLGASATNIILTLLRLRKRSRWPRCETARGPAKLLQMPR